MNNTTVTVFKFQSGSILIEVRLDLTKYIPEFTFQSGSILIDYRWQY